MWHSMAGAHPGDRATVCSQQVPALSEAGAQCVQHERIGSKPLWFQRTDDEVDAGFWVKVLRSRLACAGALVCAWLAPCCAPSTTIELRMFPWSTWERLGAPQLPAAADCCWRWITLDIGEGSGAGQGQLSRQFGGKTGGTWSMGPTTRHEIVTAISGAGLAE